MKSFLFKEPLFNQILEGNKSQTRQLINLKCNHSHLELYDFDKESQAAWFKYHSGIYVKVKSPKKVGDICYLKEPYSFGGADTKEQPHIVYKFDCNDYQLEMYQKDWQNKLFMKEVYARHFVKITNVRIERLQNISAKDAIAEGIEKGESFLDDPMYLLYDNPWLWVYDFELIDKYKVYQK